METQHPNHPRCNQQTKVGGNAYAVALGTGILKNQEEICEIDDGVMYFKATKYTYISRVDSKDHAIVRMHILRIFDAPSGRCPNVDECVCMIIDPETIPNFKKFSKGIANHGCVFSCIDGYGNSPTI
ncbi:MAG: hypothetical protein LBI69_01680 [Puniceicoccales bacterium]|nr:hypothetical protein [Puniceicoccales bacterium]